VATQRHLPHAPITEAVIDIGVEAESGASYSEIETAFGSMDFGYHESMPVWAGVFGLVMNVNVTPTSPPQSSGTAQKIGLRAQSADGKYIVTLRTNGIGVSKLAPYERWESLEEEAQRLWAIYTARFKISRVVRVATRYINILNLPMLPGASFSEYINKLVELPDELPQNVMSFVQQFQLFDQVGSNVARVALGWDGRSPADNTRVPVVLDIDIFREFPVENRNADIWEILRSMQELKNRCFFGLLTDKATDNYL
jgi:uncharacterized protein (TIGR04255 family)